MDINKMMTNKIFTMNNKRTVTTRTRRNTESCNHGSNLLESLMNLSVSVTILLFAVKSKFSLPYNRVLRVKGAMFPIAFWSVTLGLLYREHIRKKWNSFSFMNPHEQEFYFGICRDTIDKFQTAVYIRIWKVSFYIVYVFYTFAKTYDKWRW